MNSWEVDNLRRPLSGWMFCDVEMDDPAPIVNEDDQDKQDLQSGGRHDKKVDRGQFVSMLIEKSSPARGLD